MFTNCFGYSASFDSIACRIMDKNLRETQRAELTPEELFAFQRASCRYNGHKFLPKKTHEVRALKGFPNGREVKISSWYECECSDTKGFMLTDWAKAMRSPKIWILPPGLELNKEDEEEFFRKTATDDSTIYFPSEWAYDGDIPTKYFQDWCEFKEAETGYNPNNAEHELLTRALWSNNLLFALALKGL